MRFSSHKQLFYAAAKLANDFVAYHGSDRKHIHLHTGTQEMLFHHHTHKFSSITYDVLWWWFQGDGEATDYGVENNLLQRYSGILLDDFADLPPKSEEASCLLGRLLRGMTKKGKRLRPSVRIVVAGYGICEEYVDAVMGRHEFLSILADLLLYTDQLFFPKNRMWIC